MKRKIQRAGMVWAVLALLSAFVCGVQNRQAAIPADAATEMRETAPLIALTFDDGPRRDTTTALLDGLAQRGVKATFFLVGEQIVGNEDVVRRMDAEGHQIGIHTYDHVRLLGLNRSDFDAQVDKTRQLLKNVLGHDGFLLRPPYGLYDAGVKNMAGCPIILWSVDPEDWGHKDADYVTRHIMDNASDGAIILLHDIYPTSVDAALRVVDELHEQGYLFVTVEQLFAEKGMKLQNGEVYRYAGAQER